MGQGIATGTANYISTGRPLANLHHTWRDNYIAYCYSHYYPALRLIALLTMYHLLTNMNGGGSVPMIFTIMSALIWLCAPVVFTPLPGIALLKQDIRGLLEFIVAPLPHDTGVGKEALAMKVGALRGLAKNPGNPGGVQLSVRPAKEPGPDGAVSAEELTAKQIQQEEKATLRKPEEMRSLAEWGFTQELHELRSRPWQLKLSLCFVSTFQCLLVMLLVNGSILDHLYPFLLVFCLRWIITVALLMRDENNLLSFFAVLIWGLVPFLSPYMIGERSYVDGAEIFITLFIFMWLLTALRHWYLFVSCGGGTSGQRQDQVVRYAHYFFCGSDVEIVVALIVLCLQVCTAFCMLCIEKFCCCCLSRGAHTWWLLNRNVAEPTYQTKKLPYQPKLQAQWRVHSFHGERANDQDGPWMLNG